MESLRNDVCSEIYKDENKDLHHLLYFGSDLLDPDDWKDLMIQENEETLHCDLVFVQLAANYFKRQIVLIPINQPDEKSDGLEKKDEIKKKLLTVIPNEKVTNKSYYMLYFPQGQFAPHHYFQSVFKIEESASTSQHNTGWMSYEIDQLWNNVLSQKEKDNNKVEDEDEESDDDDQDANQKRKKKDNTRRNPKNMKKNTNSYVYNDVTMITPQDPAAKVIVNNTNETIKKKVNKKDPIHQIAPGEGKVCTISLLFLFLSCIHLSSNSFEFFICKLI